MPVSTAAAVRKQIAQGPPDPVYLILGDDEADMSRLAADLSAIVEEELRAFNVERLYASDRGVTAGTVAEAARILPMMASHRVVTVLRAERLLKPKRRGKGEGADDQEEQASPDAEALEAYVRAPQSSTVLVLVAADVDRTRRLYKQLQKTATIVECWGLKAAKDARPDPRQAARQAEVVVKQAAADAGLAIEAGAAKLVAERAGTDIAKLRGDVERLMLFSAGSSKVSLADAQEVVSAESAQDDWAVPNAIERGRTAEALRALGLSLESGAVPFMLLGQLAYFVREKLARTDPRRVPGAVEALLRTDLDLKSSGGDARVLLERLVIDLCAPGSHAEGARSRLAVR
jgi:DNA polymerase III delta subunit